MLPTLKSRDETNIFVDQRLAHHGRSVDRQPFRDLCTVPSRFEKDLL